VCFSSSSFSAIANWFGVILAGEGSKLVIKKKINKNSHFAVYFTFASIATAGISPVI
jgi:hypothetical protein